MLFAETACMATHRLIMLMHKRHPTTFFHHSRNGMSQKFKNRQTTQCGDLL